jgi:hypothetical protein
MKKIFLLIVSSALLSSLSACSAGSSNTMQTVLAQSTYSNASLSGTYSMSWWNFYATANGSSTYYSAIGTIQFNGNGSISGGTLTEYTPNSPYPCVFSLAGTYSLQSTALGTGTLNLSSSTKNCPATDTWQIGLAAGGSGSAVELARTDQIASGSAVKQ